MDGRETTTRRGRDDAGKAEQGPGPIGEIEQRPGEENESTDAGGEARTADEARRSGGQLSGRLKGALRAEMDGVGGLMVSEALALRVVQQLAARLSGLAGALEQRRRTRYRQSGTVGHAWPLAGVERPLEPLYIALLQALCCSFGVHAAGARPWRGVPGANSAHSAPR